jgi:hypothetical protein
MLRVVSGDGDEKSFLTAKQRAVLLGITFGCRCARVGGRGFSERSHHVARRLAMSGHTEPRPAPRTARNSTCPTTRPTPPEMTPVAAMSMTLARTDVTSVLTNKIAHPVVGSFATGRTQPRTYSGLTNSRARGAIPARPRASRASE